MARWQRSLLPGGLLAEAGTRRSARDWLVDAVLFALAAGLGALVLAVTWGEHSTATAIVDVALGIVACLSLWRRRRDPTAVGLLCAACSAVSALAAGAALAALFNAAVRASPRGLAAVTALGLAATAAYSALYPGGSAYDWQGLLIGGLLTVVAVGWGLFARARRVLILSLRDRAARLESEQRAHAEQAREAERRRIAREMHDVLAHRLSLLSVHAGALEFRPGAPAGEVAAAAGVIRSTAHAALEELREVVGVLREGGDPVAAAPEPPQPTLAQLPALVAECRAAGMRVGSRVDLPDAERLPAALGRTAYRIVQEGLTNARKHAPAAAVEVAVHGDGADRLVVEVRSRRPVAVGAGAAMPGAGTGLIGLSERVALAGGELAHGPDAHGDFVLRATLPGAP